MYFTLPKYFLRACRASAKKKKKECKNRFREPSKRFEELKDKAILTVSENSISMLPLQAPKLSSFYTDLFLKSMY